MATLFIGIDKGGRQHSNSLKDLYGSGEGGWTKGHSVFVLLRDKGYMVKYCLLPEGTPEDERLYLTVYRESSPYTNIISFLTILIITPSAVLLSIDQGSKRPNITLG